MKHQLFAWPLLLAVALTSCQQEGSNESAHTAQPGPVLQAMQGEHRSAANRARDGARKPADTLAFWGFQPDMAVVEVWPGGGWYTEVLGPALRDQGKLIAASVPDDATPAWRARMAQKYREG